MSTRIPYEKPVIIRHTLGQMNKYGRTPSQLPMGRIDGVSVVELMEQYGSPLWLLSESTLRRKYRELYQAFHLRYPRVTVAYSYKTNYLSALCAILHQEGAWAEVVSGFEYEMAQGLRVPADRIIFNGPHKRVDELERALHGGSLVNIDSFEEIVAIERIAAAGGKPRDVGLRINVEVNWPPWDRFGFNLESGQALEAAKRILSSGLLRLGGIHCHIGTYISDTEAYRKQAEKLAEFCAVLKSELAATIGYLDVGGGFASINTLHSSWAPGVETCPSFDQYAEAICPPLLRGPFEPAALPQLILEPGRALVDEAMHLLTRVVSTKRLPQGQKGVVVDAGVNLLPTSWWYRHDVVSTRQQGGFTENVNLYGPLCMQIDVLRLGVPLPPAGRGDTLIIRNVGAYNFSQSMQFIQPRPPVILINHGKTEVVRQGETTEYIKRLDKVPDRLLRDPGRA
jgi:diaminopimelate decarboxylase